MVVTDTYHWWSCTLSLDVIATGSSFPLVAVTVSSKVRGDFACFRMACLSLAYSLVLSPLSYEYASMLFSACSTV
jgi:hypothetical protein